MTKDEVLAKVYEVIDQQIQYQEDCQNDSNGTMPMYIVSVHREDELCILKHKLQKAFSE